MKDDSVKIDALRSAGFGLTFALDVLKKAESKSNDAGENVYICLDYTAIDSIYYVYHSFLIMTDDVITFVEPIKH